MLIQLVKIWFRVLGKIIKITSKRNVCNHSNYSPMCNKIWNWAIKKQEYAHALLHDMTCKCGKSQVAFLLLKNEEID